MKKNEQKKKEKEERSQVFTYHDKGLPRRSVDHRLQSCLILGPHSLQQQRKIRLQVKDFTLEDE